MYFSKTDSVVIFKETTKKAEFEKTVLLYHKSINIISDLIMKDNGECVTQGLVTLPEFGYCTEIKHEVNARAVDNFVRNIRIDNKDLFMSGLKYFMTYYGIIKQEFAVDYESDDLQLSADIKSIFWHIRSTFDENFCGLDQSIPRMHIQHIDWDDSSILQIKYFLIEEVQKYTCGDFIANYYIYGDQIIVHPIAKKSLYGQFKGIEYLPIYDNSKCVHHYRGSSFHLWMFVCSLKGLNRIILDGDYIYVFHRDKFIQTDNTIGRFRVDNLHNIDLVKNGDKLELFLNKSPELKSGVLYDRFFAAITEPIFENNKCVGRGILHLGIKLNPILFCSTITSYLEYETAYYSNPRRILESPIIDFGFRHDLFRYVHKMSYVPAYTDLGYLKALKTLDSVGYKFCNLLYEEEALDIIRISSKKIKILQAEGGFREIDIPLVCQRWEYKIRGAKLLVRSHQLYTEGTRRIIYTTRNITLLYGCLLKGDAKGLYRIHMGENNVFTLEYKDETIKYYYLVQDCPVIAIRIGEDVIHVGPVTVGYKYDRFIKSLADYNFAGCSNRGVFKIEGELNYCKNIIYAPYEENIMMLNLFLQNERRFYGDTEQHAFEYYLSKLKQDLNIIPKPALGISIHGDNLNALLENLKNKLETSKRMHSFGPRCLKIKDTCGFKCFLSGLRLIHQEKDKIIITPANNDIKELKSSQCTKQLMYTNDDDILTISEGSNDFSERMVVYNQAVDSLVQFAMDKNGDCTSYGLITLPTFGFCKSITRSSSRNSISEFINKQAYYRLHEGEDLQDFMTYYDEVKKDINTLKEYENNTLEEIQTYDKIKSLLSTKFCGTSSMLPLDEIEYIYLNERDNRLQLKFFLTKAMYYRDCANYTVDKHEFKGNVLIHPLKFKTHVPSIHVVDVVAQFRVEAESTRCRITKHEIEINLTCNTHNLSRIILGGAAGNKSRYIYAFYEDDDGNKTKQRFILNKGNYSDIVYRTQKNYLIWRWVKITAESVEKDQPIVLYDKLSAVITNPNNSCTTGTKPLSLFGSCESFNFDNNDKNESGVSKYLILSAYLRNLDLIPIVESNEYFKYYKNHLTKLKADISEHCSITEEVEQFIYGIKKVSKKMRVYGSEHVVYFDIPSGCENFNYNATLLNRPASGNFSLSIDDKDETRESNIIFLNSDYDETDLFRCVITAPEKYLNTIFVTENQKDYIFQIDYEIYQNKITLSKFCDVLVIVGDVTFIKPEIKSGFLYDRFISVLVQVEDCASVQYALSYQACSQVLRNADYTVDRRYFIKKQTGYLGIYENDLKFYVDSFLEDLRYAEKDADKLNLLISVVKGRICSYKTNITGLDKVIIDQGKLKISVNSKIVLIDMKYCSKQLVYTRTDYFFIDFKSNGVDIGPEPEATIIYHRAVESLSNITHNRLSRCTTNGIITLAGFGFCTSITHDKEYRLAVEDFMKKEALYHGHTSGDIKDFTFYYNELRRVIEIDDDMNAVKILMNSKFCGFKKIFSTKDIEYIRGERGVFKYKYFMSKEEVVDGCENQAVRFHKYKNQLSIHPYRSDEEQVLYLEYKPNYNDIVGLCTITTGEQDKYTGIKCEMYGLDRAIITNGYVYIFNTRSQIDHIVRFELQRHNNFYCIEDSNPFTFKAEDNIVLNEHVLLFDRFIYGFTYPLGENCTSTGIFSFEDPNKLLRCKAVIDDTKIERYKEDWGIWYYGRLNMYYNTNYNIYRGVVRESWYLISQQLNDYVEMIQNVVTNKRTDYGNILHKLQQDVSSCFIINVGTNIEGSCQMQDRLAVYGREVVEYQMAPGCSKLVYTHHDTMMYPTHFNATKWPYSEKGQKCNSYVADDELCSFNHRLCVLKCTRRYLVRIYAGTNGDLDVIYVDYAFKKFFFRVKNCTSSVYIDGEFITPEKGVYFDHVLKSLTAINYKACATNGLFSLGSLPPCLTITHFGGINRYNIEAFIANEMAFYGHQTSKGTHIYVSNVIKYLTNYLLYYYTDDEELANKYLSLLHLMEKHEQEIIQPQV